MTSRVSGRGPSQTNGVLVKLILVKSIRGESRGGEGMEGEAKEDELELQRAIVESLQIRSHPFSRPSTELSRA